MRFPAGTLLACPKWCDADYFVYQPSAYTYVPRWKGAARVSLQAELRQFIVENYLLSRDESLLRDSDSLTAHGILDSTGALELAMYLEQRYGITVQDEELHPDNLDSIDRIAAFIERKRA